MICRIGIRDKQKRDPDPCLKLSGSATLLENEVPLGESSLMMVIDGLFYVKHLHICRWKKGGNLHALMTGQLDPHLFQLFSSKHYR